jgi:hypothetical protein
MKGSWSPIFIQGDPPAEAMPAARGNSRDAGTHEAEEAGRMARGMTATIAGDGRGGNGLGWKA